ncbi:MAG TPA: DUF4956 domain-containing protein [Allosphingosinicella sp.]|nr:DUF4956 domain-containing protein [Allosphingosinicella sp.]
MVVGALWLFPGAREFLPVGGVEALITDSAGGPLDPLDINASRVANLRESLLWLIVAIAGSLLTALPVSWTYMEIRNREEYDQSLVETIIVLPIAVTSIVILVHNSLALAFSLAGIVGGVRFRNSLKSSGDALFVLLSIGIGLAAGVGAMELAIVMSLAFNYCFLALWATDYGARKGTHRYLRKNHAHRRQGELSGAAAENGKPPEAPVQAQEATGSTFENRDSV